MNRVLAAFVLGLVVPIVWFLLCYAVTLAVFIPGLTDIRINGVIAPGLLWAPIAIPTYLLMLLKDNGVLLRASDFHLELAILFNWALYGTIFYLLLGKLTRFKTPSAIGSTPPLNLSS